MVVSWSWNLQNRCKQTTFLYNAPQPQVLCCSNRKYANKILLFNFFKTCRQIGAFQFPKFGHHLKYFARSLPENLLPSLNKVVSIFSGSTPSLHRRCPESEMEVCRFFRKGIIPLPGGRCGSFSLYSHWKEAQIRAMMSNLMPQLHLIVKHLQKQTNTQILTTAH